LDPQPFPPAPVGQLHAQFTRSCALFALVQAWKAVTLFFDGDPFVNAAGAVSGVIVVAIWLALAAAVMQRRRSYLRVTAAFFFAVCYAKAGPGLFGAVYCGAGLPALTIPGAGVQLVFQTLMAIWATWIGVAALRHRASLGGTNTPLSGKHPR